MEDKLTEQQQQARVACYNKTWADQGSPADDVAS